MPYPTDGYSVENVTLTFSYFNFTTEDQLFFAFTLPVLSDAVTDLIESNIKSAIASTYPGYTDQSYRTYGGHAKVDTHA